MISRGVGGSIINIASASGKKPDLGGSAYNPSKSAIIGLTRVMALELGQFDSGCPVLIHESRMVILLGSVFESEPGLQRVLEERTPLGKMAQPSDQANACIFLASELASHITGEQLVVSGGEFMDT